MAQSIHLSLTIDGNDVVGESTIESLERADTIECSTFEDFLETPREETTGKLTGRRIFRPVTITKRIDQSTPLLFKALCLNEPVNMAHFKFYRPSPGGSGAEEHFLSIELENSYVSKISRKSEDAIMAGESAPPMMERVSFHFQDITVTYVPNGATHKDSWKGE